MTAVAAERALPNHEPVPDALLRNRRLEDPVAQRMVESVSLAEAFASIDQRYREPSSDDAL
jgi:hypothetical protein